MTKTARVTYVFFLSTYSSARPGRFAAGKNIKQVALYSQTQTNSLSLLFFLRLSGLHLMIAVRWHQHFGLAFKREQLT